MNPKLRLRELLALAWAGSYGVKPPPHSNTLRALQRKQLVRRVADVADGAVWELTDHGSKTLEDYGGGAYIVAKYATPTAAARDVEEGSLELRAAELAAEIEGKPDMKVSELRGGEWAGWLIHQYDSLRGDLDDGESAGYLARQIVEHEDNHEDPPVDVNHAFQLLLEATIGFERYALVRDLSIVRSTDVVNVIRRAIDEHASRSGFGSNVQRYRSKGL